jgi:EF hand domain-containing protein
VITGADHAMNRCHFTGSPALPRLASVIAAAHERQLLASLLNLIHPHTEIAMNKRMFAASAAALAMLAATASLPARAQTDDLTFTKIFEMADKNKDTMITKQEFLDAMSKAYDMKMEKYKAAKDSKMMKGDAMTKDGLKGLINDVHHGA